MACFGVCPKCKFPRWLTKHHIYPVRHYGRKGNNDILLLCRACHDKIEKIIPFERRKKSFYTHIVEFFLNF
jgi:hypothetical protein